LRFAREDPVRKARHEGSKKMSTAVLYPNAAAEWKQEVNRRLAAHRVRRGQFVQRPAEPAQNWAVSSGRGALVAARVAARYACAPSYSQLQSIEAPVAARAAQTAPPAAVKPRVDDAPRAFATELQAAVPVMHSSEPEAQPPVTFAPLSELPPAPALTLVSVPAQTTPAQANAPHMPPESLDAWESECQQIGWRPDPGLRPVDSDWVRSSLPVVEHVSPLEERHEPSARVDEFFGSQDLEPVEPDQPIHANLIEFPREVVAVRKMRPRRAERAFMAEGMDRQLSIFEVAPDVLAPPSPAEPEPVAVAWSQPEWSGIKLKALPQEDAKHEERSEAEADVHLAPAGHRLMAVLVDGALITAVFLMLAIVGAASAGSLPAPKFVALGVTAGVLLIGLLYQTIFLLLAEATPGMKYAGISLCTFENQIPTPPELRSRLGALLLSVAPVGLGVAWALFDEDHLCWHDRLSRTYLRKE
jgi:uncharacterized RDD family membrane protein YckC